MDSFQASVQFIGNATTLLRIGPFTLLTDPNFLHKGQRAYLGYGLTSRRRTDPALTLEELPALDAVLLSHLHGDHFDRVARRGLDRSVPVLTTREASRRLQQWGFDARALRPWESRALGRDGARLRVTAVPGRHAPGPAARLLPPVMGSVLQYDGARGDGAGSTRLTVYVTGDTLVHDDLALVRERFPAIDLALVHLGGTRVLGLLLTMDGRQGVRLLDLVRPAHALPIHMEDYGVFRSPPQDFADALARARLPTAVHWLRPGHVLDLAPILRGESPTSTARPIAAAPTPNEPSRSTT